MNNNDTKELLLQIIDKYIAAVKAMDEIYNEMLDFYATQLTKAEREALPLDIQHLVNNYLIHKKTYN